MAQVGPTALSFRFRACTHSHSSCLMADGTGRGLDSDLEVPTKGAVAEGKRKRFLLSHFFRPSFFSLSRNSKTVPQGVFCGRRWVTRNETWHFQGYPVHFQFLLDGHRRCLSCFLLFPPWGFFPTFHVAVPFFLYLGWRLRVFDPLPPRRPSTALGFTIYPLRCMNFAQIVGRWLSLFLVCSAQATAATMNGLCM